MKQLSVPILFGILKSKKKQIVNILLDRLHLPQVALTINTTILYSNEMNDCINFVYNNLFIDF